MTKRIFRSISIVAVSVFVASLVLIMGVLYGYFSDLQQKQLKAQTMLVAYGISSDGMDYLDYFNKNIDKDCRITLIDKEGNVLYDSQSQSQNMENHLEREEIKEAFSKGYGESRRYSATLMERSLYCAKLLDDQTVVRLSVSQNTILTLILGMVQPICVVFAVAIILSVILAIRLAKDIVKPLNELNLNEPLSNKEYDELSPLLRRIDSQQRQLKWQESELEHKQTELTAIVNNMKEGIILLNRSGKILSINPAAANLLNADNYCIGSDILTVSRNLSIQEILIKALDGEPAERTIMINDGYYQVDANPIISGTKVSGAAILLFDVTQKEKAEQMRREFSANVSHELKTPLHVISGYAELIQNGMVENKDIIPFAGKIYAESQRMVQLVEDIISLSHLDEGAGEMKREDVELYSLACSAADSLKDAAKEAGVTIEVDGETAYINGISHLLYSIVYNLCDNAIKYNNIGGKVAVEVKKEPQYVILSVSDTGIGISPEHRERIFERFYRVDKSHSKEVGGTGLGLSIVKHAAKIHNGRIDIKSAVGEGTTITVKFPVQ